MSDDYDDIDIPLDKKQQQLREAIISNPDEAWNLLRRDPVMIIAFTRVRRELEQEEVNDNVQKFFDIYYKNVRLIFGKENPIHEYGIALTAELLTEYWRQTTNSSNLSSINEALLKKMAILVEAADHLPEGTNAKVTSQIVDYSTQRIIDFSDYDRFKANSMLVTLDPYLDELITKVSSSSEVTDELLALAYFASSSTESIEILRNEIAAKLLVILRNRFESYNEADKFKIAPWLQVFEQITKE